MSYRHHANGYGLDMDGRFVYELTKYVALQAGAGYLHWQTGNGTDQLYLNNGQVDKTQLNGVYRDGFKVFGGLRVSL